MVGLLTAFVTGAGAGLTHSLETDHLATVSVLTDGDSEVDGRGASAGASWGLGHSIVVMSVGCAFLLLGYEPPSWLTEFSELLAGVVLVYLGWRSILLTTSSDSTPLETLESHEHLAGGHSRSHTHLHLGSFRIGFGHSHVDADSFAIGIVHGLAGSGGMVVFLAASSSSNPVGYTYLLSFAGVTITVMSVLSAFWGTLLERKPRHGRRLFSIAGVLSLVSGVLLVVGVV